MSDNLTPENPTPVDAAQTETLQFGQNEAPAGHDAPDVAAQLAALEAKANAHYEDFLRARAETENVRRRAQDDIGKAHKFAAEKFATAMLPVKDSLEAALATQNVTLETLKEGVELTLRQMQSAFQGAGLTEENPLGEKFDPNKHQAIGMVPNPEVPANHVAQVLQKGYTLNDRVIRPALVMVSQGA